MYRKTLLNRDRELTASDTACSGVVWRGSSSKVDHRSYNRQFRCCHFRKLGVFVDQVGAERVHSKPVTQLECLITVPTRLDKPGIFYVLHL